MTVVAVGTVVRVHKRTVLKTTNEAIERRPLQWSGSHWTCPYCFASYPAMRQTPEGRMPLPEAISRGLVRPVCQDCGGAWA
jgi:transposase-like protein